MMHGIDAGMGFMIALALVLVGTVLLRFPERLPEMGRQFRSQASMMLVRVPFALLAASFLSALMPADLIGRLLGSDSGMKGIALSALLGGFVPGGPMISFPIALVIWDRGAGPAQMVTFLAAWSIFAVHRIISYELPLMGPRFVGIRLASSWMLPPVAGVLAALLISLFPSWLH
jgi:uncharacterized membrane protein YraQ (UPF0718 family)